MSVYRTHFYLTFDTLTHAQTVKNSILTNFGQNLSFSKISAELNQDENERPQVNGDFYYETASSRDVVNKWIDTQRTTMPVKNWIITGWIAWHKWDNGKDLHDPASEFGEIYL